MLVTGLTLLALVSAALHIRAEGSAGAKLQVYLFKPLTMVWIILIALLAKSHVSSFYKYMIVAGLVCSLLGDIFLMLPSDRFVQGLLSFLVAHLFYIAAFASGGVDLLSAFLYAIPFLIYGGIMLRLLFPHVGRMKLPVVVYMLVILVMAWLALSRWAATGQTGSALAFLGALLFTASDSTLAVNRFKGRIDHAQFYILSTYFSAQWLIALSI
ncbi:MAG: lysoplasmalogenase [Pyrinomonadaceae bacterium]